MATQSRRIVGEYRLITKQVELTPAHTVEEDIPQRTQTVQRRILVKDETIKETIVPAEYNEFTK